MPENKVPRAPVEVDVSAAAAALGRIKTPQKAAASRRNLCKATASMTPEERSARAKNANAARNKSMTPEERSERARNAVLARWNKAKKSG